MKLFGDAESATEANTHTKVVAVIRTVVNQSVAKAVHSSTLQTALEEQ